MPNPLDAKVHDNLHRLVLVRSISQGSGVPCTPRPRAGTQLDCSSFPKLEHPATRRSRDTMATIRAVMDHLCSALCDLRHPLYSNTGSLGGSHCQSALLKGAHALQCKT